MDRRDFFASASVIAAGTAFSQMATEKKPLRIILRSSWQTVNIGDIAHTPGMLRLLEQHLPDAQIMLWPNQLSADVEQLLLKRFPKLVVLKNKADQQTALQQCDFFLHGSGPGLVGRNEVELARQAGKPYGFAGVTLNDDEIKNQRELLNGAKFVYTRDTESLKALKQSDINRPAKAFGPDATFAVDLRDETAAAKLLKEHQLESGKFLCAVPRLRWTPYWEIHPERVKPNPVRSAENEAFADRDHAKLREAIISWVREVKLPVFLVPEMTYQVSRLKPLLFDPLPAEIKKQVRVLERYWLSAEAATVYQHAAAVISFEMHSPILAIAAGTPAIHLRQPTDTRKGQMWRDIGLEEWLFEIDRATGADIAEKLVTIGADIPAARKKAVKARQFAQHQMETMIGSIR